MGEVGEQFFRIFIGAEEGLGLVDLSAVHDVFWLELEKIKNQAVASQCKVTDKI